MINSKQGFFETLVINKTDIEQNQNISQEKIINNNAICNKIYNSISKINGNYFISSQFPNITKILPTNRKPSLEFSIAPIKKNINKTLSNKSKVKNKSLKKIK